MKVIIGFGSGGTQDESKSEPQVNQPKEIIIASCHSDHDSCHSDHDSCLSDPQNGRSCHVVMLPLLFQVAFLWFAGFWFAFNSWRLELN